MHLIRVGRRRINLEYLICDEECGEAAVGVLVTLRHGETFRLAGDDAESYRRQVEPLVRPEPAGGGPAGDAGTGVGDVAPLPLAPEADGGDVAGARPGDGLRPQRG